MNVRWWLAAGLVWASAGCAFAQTLSARFNTSVYAWERQVGASASVRQVRLYQTAGIDLENLGSPHVGFHTFLRTSFDAANAPSEDPRHKIYSTYVNFRNLGRDRVDLRLGRQVVLSGVGIGSIDGGRVWLRPTPGLELTGYAGTLSPQGESQQFIGWQEGHLVGGTATIRSIPHSQFRVSFARRNREAFAVAPGGERFRVNSVQRQLLGFDYLLQMATPWSAYGRLDLDLTGISNDAAGKNLKVKRSEILLRYQLPERLYLTAEHIFRHPTISANSFFINFREFVRSNHEIGVRGDVWLTDRWRLNARYAAVLYAGDETHRIDAGIMYRDLYVAYVKRLGYGGERDGVIGSLYLPLHPAVGLRAGADFSSLRIIEDAPQENRLFSVFVGVAFRPRRNVSLDFEVQDLTQNIKGVNFFDEVRFPGAGHDVRVFARFGYWFFGKADRRLGRAGS